MRYCILAYTDNIEPFEIPRQLGEVNGEPLIKRTVRLLRENGVKDILITSKDPRFDIEGAVRYEPLHNDWNPRANTGYWLSAFPEELLNEPITFLLGDCYYSEDAIRTIIKTPTKSVMYFCSYKNSDERYLKIKHHDEPFAFKVVDGAYFKQHIDRCKRLFDQGKIKRNPICWELYRSLNGIPIMIHKISTNVTVINDESTDVDTPENLILLNGR